MRKLILLGLAAASSLSLGACTTYDRYGYDGYGRHSNRQLEGAATGAAIGAVGGAAVGAIVPGVSPVEGAAVGAVVGGVAGAVNANDRRWYPDSRGYCYYVNDRGDRVYDYDRRC